MAQFSGFDPSAFTEACLPACLEIAADIAADVKDHYPTVEAHPTDRGATAMTHGSFDHLKEWGSVNNPPKGYMRAAAASRGRYTPEGK